MISTNLFNFCLILADERFILSHRLSELCGHGPSLEEDIALTNVALDLLGQANEFYEFASTLEEGKSADEIAFLRTDVEYKNIIMSELENGDFASVIVRQFFFDVYSYYLYSELINSKDSNLSAIAEKSLKEVTYHLRHSKKWFHILADGTEESRSRLLEAIDSLWTYTYEMFDSNDIIDALEKEGIAPNFEKIKSSWEKEIKSNFKDLNIDFPINTWFHSGGRTGKHSEHLGKVLTEMQYLQRTFPNAQW